jgi:hypothetical protein
MHKFSVWRGLLALSFAVVAAACSGSVATQRLTQERINNNTESMDGVVFYQPALFAEMMIKTLSVQDGKMFGRSSDSPPVCIEVSSERVVMMPDLERPYQIRYRPGLFDSNTLGVSLNQGMLAAVNSTPVPQSPNPLLGNLMPGGVPMTGLGLPFGLPITGSSPGAMPPRAMEIQMQTPGLPPCNEGPVVVGYRRLTLPAQTGDETGR